MLSKRVIACLDVRDGHLAKSVKFVDTKNIGDPVEKAHETTWMASMSWFFMTSLRPVTNAISCWTS